MSEIHQIYCTHCTYGTSALERREGEIASRVLGYSARSSSLDLAGLRKRYRDVERFLYYYLPPDTPPDDKLRLDAASAPRRLVYYPSINGLQILGQISYRQQDTAGRPGSYFGHVVFAERSSGSWNVIDCLQLWGANWKDEDSPNIRHKISRLKGLEELRGKAQPIINDALLLSFLQTPNGQPFEDPDGVIPPRWERISDTDRRKLLTDVLQGFLSLADNRRESVLLVIEPALAALVFYGVVRLLPPGRLRDEVSFSTFEPSADRQTVTLAATTFSLPEATDLKPDVYRGRGYVNNTFLKKCSTRSALPGKYAGLVVGRFLANEPDRLDRLLQGFEAAGANNANDLEELAQVEEQVPALLDPNAAMPRIKGTGVTANYLGRALSDRLASEPAGSSVLSALVGTPRHLNTLNLIATDAALPETAEHVRFLINKLPEDAFEGLVASETIARDVKIEALVNFLEGKKRFPEPCPHLWKENARGDKRQAGSQASILAEVLAKLPDSLLEELPAKTPASNSDRFLLALLEVCRRNPTKSSAVRLVGQQIDRLDEDKLCEFLIRTRAELTPQQYPTNETALRERLPGLLKGLAKCGRQFDERLNLLTAWLNHFPDVGDVEKRLAHWRTIRGTLVALRDVPPAAQQTSLGRIFKKSPIDYDATGLKLAQAFKSAMPSRDYPEDDGWVERLRCLRNLGSLLIGHSDFLPSPIWEKLRNFVQYGTWSIPKFGKSKLSSKARHPAKKGPRRSMRNSVLLIAFFIFVGLVPSVCAVLYFGGESGKEVTQADSSKEPKAQAIKPPTKKPVPPKGTSGPEPARPAPDAESNDSPDPAGDQSGATDNSATPPSTTSRENSGDRNGPEGAARSAPREKVTGDISTAPVQTPTLQRRPARASTAREYVQVTEHHGLPIDDGKPIKGNRFSVSINSQLATPTYTIHLPAEAQESIKADEKIKDTPTIKDKRTLRAKQRSFASVWVAMSDNPSLRFNWEGDSRDHDPNAVRLVRACVLEINTEAPPHAFISLSDPFHYDDELQFNRPMKEKNLKAQLPIKDVLHAAGGTSTLKYSVCRGRVHWNGQDCPFEVVPDGRSYPLASNTTEAPQRNASIAVTIGHGNVDMTLTPTDDTSEDQIKDVTVSARLSRKIDTGDGRTLEITDITIGNR